MRSRWLWMVLLCGAAAIRASANEPSVDQIKARIESLRARINQLDAQQRTANEKDVDAVVERVLTDAENRSKFLSASDEMIAGFSGTHAFIGSADGRFTLIPGVLFQMRDATNFNFANSDYENGFVTRRLKIYMDGNAFGPDFTFRFLWETNFSDGSVFLQDAWVLYRITDGWSLRIGQFKEPWNKEECAGDFVALACDRSLMNALIGGGQTLRSQGVSLIHAGDKHRAEIMFDDGLSTINSGFQNTQSDSTLFPFVTDFGVSGRVDYLIKGLWRDADDFTALAGREELIDVGAGFSFTQGGANDIVFYTLDAQYKNTHGFA
ncbi:MAG: porin, partial [Tepidisphaeraceae bacterium]